MHNRHMVETLRRDLAHIYWMGGSPCSGKSSIADILTVQYGLQLYRCDDAFYRHTEKATAEHQPVLYKIARMTWEQIWMRPVDEQVEDELAAYREQFSFILEDLLAMPASRPVVVEGAALLPELVDPLVSDRRRAIWVVPTAEFQLHHYSQRDWAKSVVKDCSDPRQAFENWMGRDIGFARRVRQDAEARGFEALVVDGARTIEENSAAVIRAWGLPDPDTPNLSSR